MGPTLKDCLPQHAMAIITIIDVETEAKSVSYSSVPWRKKHSPDLPLPALAHNPAAYYSDSLCTQKKMHFSIVKANFILPFNFFLSLTFSFKFVQLFFVWLLFLDANYLYQLIIHLKNWKQYWPDLLLEQTLELNHNDNFCKKLKSLKAINLTT